MGSTASMVTRFPVRLALGLALCIALAGCGGSGTGGRGGGGGDGELLDHRAMLREYAERVEEFPFPLPEGYAFPKPEALPTPAVPTLYQKGNGVVRADTAWMCAWLNEWLEAWGAGDSGRAQEALRWLEKLPETEFIASYSDLQSFRAFEAAVLERARLGDPEPVRGMLGSCRDIIELMKRG